MCSVQTAEEKIDLQHVNNLKTIKVRLASYKLFTASVWICCFLWTIKSVVYATILWFSINRPLFGGYKAITFSLFQQYTLSKASL